MVNDVCQPEHDALVRIEERVSQHMERAVNADSRLERKIDVLAVKVDANSKAIATWQNMGKGIAVTVALASGVVTFLATYWDKIFGRHP